MLIIVYIRVCIILAMNSELNYTTSGCYVNMIGWHSLVVSLPHHLIASLKMFSEQLYIKKWIR